MLLTPFSCLFSLIVCVTDVLYVCVRCCCSSLLGDDARRFDPIRSESRPRRSPPTNPSLPLDSTRRLDIALTHSHAHTMAMIPINRAAVFLAQMTGTTPAQTSIAQAATNNTDGEGQTRAIPRGEGTHACMHCRVAHCMSAQLDARPHIRVQAVHGGLSVHRLRRPRPSCTRRCTCPSALA
jgi:hypothetical protein